jgi:toxin ParE1/3/4
VAYTLSKAARADLVDIAEYTIDRWGDAQAQKYVDDLLRRCAEAGDNPNAGKSSDDVLNGYRRIHEGRHVIYFRRVGSDVEIVRVLHDRMLPAKHLR